VFTSELKCTYVLKFKMGALPRPPNPPARRHPTAYVPAPYLLKYSQKLISRDGSESMVGERVSWFVRRETHKCAGDEPRNDGLKQSLHRCKKELQESTWKQSESLTLAKGYVSFYLHCTRAKKTIVAAVPMLEISSRSQAMPMSSNRHLKSYGLSVSRSDTELLRR